MVSLNEAMNYEPNLLTEFCAVFRIWDEGSVH